MLKTYLSDLAEVANRGDATEESYYHVLENLLNTYSNSTGDKNTHITILPKKTEAGNPDFRVWDGNVHITGYIEAKAPTIDNLDKIEKTQQLKRYLHTFPNVILTNFLEFRLYRNGEQIEKAVVGSPVIFNNVRAVPPIENEPMFMQLLEKFFAFSVPSISTAATLAEELAKRTRFLKDEAITLELAEEAKTGKGFIRGFYKAFKDYLISSLTESEFSNLYAQTITYGLFAARSRSENGFNRKLAYDNIPQTIGILRDVFQFISLGSPPKQMELIIDDISEVLAVTDIHKLLHQYYHDGKGADPIIHFYETFLSVYDPKTREMRGVYYTPEPVVAFIVRCLHSILKEQFDSPDGFSDRNVTVLDPAAGTLTFLAETAKVAVEEFVTKYGEGGKDNFIREHILKNFYAFELMMAPYAVGHIKMSFLLEELGYKLQKDERVKLYLTNSLDMEVLAEAQLPGMFSLSEESHMAGEIKRQQPILVVLGNPPYSVSSVNKSVFIEKEMDAYKKEVKAERNIQPLSDDYIKFIRFAHSKIEQSGKGIIGMITNNSYLSGLIHRGMRRRLLESFNEIYIVNLHGNSRIGEKSPDGGKDENVFDIQQGVSIVLFVRNSKHKQDTLGKVFYQDVYGLRKNKFVYLNNSDIHSVDWIQLKPTEPYYFFVEKDFSLQADYDKFVSVVDIFNKYSSGVKTHRDDFCIGFTDNEVKQRMRTFSSDLSDDLVARTLDLKDTPNWKLKSARENVKKLDWVEYIRPYSYRPFDIRAVCYLPDFIDRGRWSFMQNFFNDNLGLCLKRNRFIKVFNFKHVFISKYLSDGNFMGDQSFIYPLFAYPSKEKNALLHADEGTRQPNIKPEMFKLLNSAYNKEITPEEIFYYMYAVLYCERYREKYAEFLKIDFPKIPFTNNYELFKNMVEYGSRLVELHLLKSKELNVPIARFQGYGDGKVEKPVYKAQDSHVFINKNQYFEGVSGQLWSYQIGGYQVCEKWLKDRKERTLTLSEIQTYCRIVTAIDKTIEVQKSIDDIYDKLELQLIQRGGK